MGKQRIHTILAGKTVTTLKPRPGHYGHRDDLARIALGCGGGGD